MPDLIGLSLGRYRILEQLGEGGMATVYKAYDTRLERDVAVKIIRRAAFPPEQLDRILKRFEREAKALAKLSHPNIVGVIDYGDYEGSPYLVMEFLPSGTLKGRLGKPIPWQEAARLLLPVARALQFAHKQGIVHRDIKPSNILITESGEPMLADFGIAKILESGEAATLTGTGIGVGTPEYMAPEQWTGNVTAQSDIYSLGIVFYEMITGRKPYTADTPAAVMLKQATEPLPRPGQFVHNLPEGVERLLLKALARRPEDRYRDVVAFIDALENVIKNIGKKDKIIENPPILGKIPFFRYLAVAVAILFFMVLSFRAISLFKNKKTTLMSVTNKTPPPITSTMTLTKFPVLSITSTKPLKNTPTEVITPLGGGLGMIAFFSRRPGDISYQIYKMKVDGTGITRLTTGEESGAPQWSPDGSRIVFVTYSNNQGDIFIMDQDGRNRKQLTDNPAWDVEPAWSPDGTQIAFVSDRNGIFDIYRMDENGGDVIQITHDMYARNPAWSPDGSHIAFIYMNSLYMMNADGTNLTYLTGETGTDTQRPDWSPDGRHILFMSRKDDPDPFNCWQSGECNYELYTINLGDYSITRLTDNPLYDTEPSWSPDGSKIVFSSNREGIFGLYIMDADGSNVRCITSGFSDQSPNWSP